MAKDLFINQNLIIPRSEIGLTFSRSSGSGGQNVNKVNSKVTLRWDFKNSSVIPDHIKKKFFAQNANNITNTGEFLISSSESRDQPINIQSCYDKLKRAVLNALKVRLKRIKTKPSKASKEKRLNSKKLKSFKKANRQKNLIKTNS